MPVVDPSDITEIDMVPLLSLGGKVAIVTGAASGIGAATATLFAQAGAQVALADSREAELQLTADGLRGEGFDVLAVRTDVGNVEESASLVEVTVTSYGGVDVVVNNAAVGTVVVGGTIETIVPELWDLAQNVNLRGAYLVSRSAIPHMRQGGGGSIVNISSSAVFRSDPRRPSHAYVASKGGLLALTQAMAVSLGGDNIRVNAILPGVVRSRLTTDIIDRVERRTAEGRGIPLRRVGEPGDVAKAVLFLASDWSSFITGASLAVDGGGLVVSGV